MAATRLLPQEIADFSAILNDLPPEYADRLRPILLRVLDANKRRRRLLRLVQDAMAQLRLDMKYLLFDLDATRRERDALRRQLES